MEEKTNLQDYSNLKIKIYSISINLFCDVIFYDNMNDLNMNKAMLY